VSGHQTQGFFTRGCVLFHVALAVKLIARIQKEPVIARPDQLIERFHGKAFVEIDLFKLSAGGAKQTLRVATGGSRGFQIELHIRASSSQCTSRR
jgi:hypothetical protein